MIYVIERAIFCRHMAPCIKVVVTNLFIFFVFADHTDGFSWWDQWKQHESATESTNSSRGDPGDSRPKNQRKRCVRFQHDGPSTTAAATTATAPTTSTKPTEQGQWNRNKNELDYKLFTTKYDRERSVQYVRHYWPS